ncbi:MAG: Z1 domain-containing protein, partial [Thiobacillus sp.]|nr:Z1 domain-containing protein [Thiobacillus sp.]
QTSSHKTYKAWMDKSLTTLKSYVERQYQKTPADVEARFKAEYNTLKETYPELKPLHELIESMVNDVFGEMNCVEVNGTPDAEKKVNWKSTPYWILVGGAKLDRGYTVEGLAITYMPRPLGSSPAADTLQQRARFFGYKKSYLGLCRVFVQDSVREAFSDYVDHEEFVRSALISNRGKPLREWRRDFILGALLKPTRPNVIGLSTRRIPVDGWLVPSALQRDADAAELNRSLLTNVERNWKERFGPAVNTAEFPQFKGKKDVSSNFVLAAIPLRVVLDEFLLNVQARDPADAEEHSAMLIAMAELLCEDESLKADVFLMNNLAPQYRTRDAGRGFPAGHPNAPINQYFSNSADQINDKSFLSTERVSLQLRRFDLGTTQRTKSSADILNVTWFALNVPRVLSKNLHIEGRS